jgi:ABC-type dipeptide/oligopeptide/nickel transport system permease component
VASAMLNLSGDPIALMFQSGVADPAQMASLRHQLGLDQSLLVQFLHFLRGVLAGDLGSSLRFRRPNSEIIFGRLPATLLLTVAAMTFAIGVAVPTAIVSAIRPRSPLAFLGRMVVLIGQSVPLFWLGILLVLMFTVKLRWLPAAGNVRPGSLIMPALTLGLYPMARIARTLRASLRDALEREYMVTARAKGLSERQAVLAHALRNAALPVLTVIGLQFGTLLGGAIVTETIFSWPGIGLLSIQAVQARDLPLVRAIIVVVSVMLITVNLLTDIAYAWLNPRVHLR